MKTIIGKIVFLVFTIGAFSCSTNNKKKMEEKEPDFTKVPGTVIFHIPAETRNYLGSPAIIIMPNGDYTVALDINSFSEERLEDESTLIFKSSDKGLTWKKISELKTQHWASLFYYENELYIVGTKAKYNDLIVQKSSDGGKTWSNPKNQETGLIAKGNYHCAPVPVVVHNNRIWRGIEKVTSYENKGDKLALVMSAPLGADLLKSSSWTLSNTIQYQNDWLKGSNGWMEGNMVVDPNGDIKNILRVQAQKDMGLFGIAAVVDVDSSGESISIDPENCFINLPGGTGKKFTVRYDSISSKYWSLTNWIPSEYRTFLENGRSGRIRNTLALVSSPDLKSWKIERIVLHHPDFEKHGFQYADWRIEENDIVAVVRTAFDDGLGGSYNYHNANFITFHKVPDFRSEELNHFQKDGTIIRN